MARINVNQESFNDNMYKFWCVLGYVAYFGCYIGTFNFFSLFLGQRLFGDFSFTIGLWSILGLGVYHAVQFITQGETPLHQINNKIKLFGWETDVTEGTPK